MRAAVRKVEVLPITVLRLVDEGAWANRVAAEVEEAHGDMYVAAAALGCGLATLARWLPAVEEAVGRGLPRRPRGRPKGSRNRAKEARKQA